MSPSGERAALAALQRGIPIAPRPFDEIARAAGCGAGDVVALVERLRAEGKVRRFGAVFDARRMGYSSALCAASVPPDEIASAASRIVSLAGVTHCYLREAEGHPEFPGLWFTLSYPADVFPAMADEARSRLAPFALDVLPALRRFKVDVVFGAESRTREERVEGDCADPLPDAAGRAAIRALQGDTEVREDYFAAVAGKVDAELAAAGLRPVREWGLLSKLEMWRRSGRLKRVGLLLAHRQAGWTSNGMCCWNVEGDATGKGRLLAKSPHVTHCYERPRTARFPFNLFAMIHARSAGEAKAKFAALEENCELSGGTMLVSTREFKKTSMTFW